MESDGKGPELSGLEEHFFVGLFVFRRAFISAGSEGPGNASEDTMRELRGEGWGIKCSLEKSLRCYSLHIGGFLDIKSFTFPLLTAWGRTTGQ